VSYSVALLLVACCIVIETTEQSLYRLAGRNRGRFLFHVGPAVTLHIGGLMLWFLLLKHMPLGQALPLMGANFVTIALVGRIAFGETIDLRRWTGIGLILAGFVLVAMKPL
jgi:multidrug transporter EmrE-like cation transporter